MRASYPATSNKVATTTKGVNAKIMINGATTELKPYQPTLSIQFKTLCVRSVDCIHCVTYATLGSQ